MLPSTALVLAAHSSAVPRTRSLVTSERETVQGVHSRPPKRPPTQKLRDSAVAACSLMRSVSSSAFSGPQAGCPWGQSTRIDWPKAGQALKGNIWEMLFSSSLPRSLGLRLPGEGTLRESLTPFIPPQSRRLRTQTPKSGCQLGDTQGLGSTSCSFCPGQSGPLSPPSRNSEVSVALFWPEPLHP